MAREQKDEVVLELPALEIPQGPGRCLYSFAVDGKEIPRFATVSRVRRQAEESNTLLGYQRAEVISHIREIRKYLESPDPLLPNSIVVAFDDRVAFVANQGQREGSIRHGILRVPVDPDTPAESKPAWIVDGQQRIAAIQEADIESFPVSVVGFQAKDDHDQRDQFILVNTTKPLPTGLVYELLPTTAALLPERFRRRQFPAYLVERLNYDALSPLRGMVRTHTNTEGVIKDNSVLRMLENSLNDGILYWYRDPIDDKHEVDDMLSILFEFWAAVRDVFPDAWGLSPRKSRLMHGAGVVSMGLVMDAIAESYRRDGPAALTEDLFHEELDPLRNECRWTSGFWEFRSGERRRWNEIQNVTRDIQALSDHLLGHYRTHLRSLMAASG